MGFQFQCPQGHLLEADDSDVGKTCTCPYCGLMIQIPSPSGADPLPQVSPAPGPPAATPAGPPPLPATDPWAAELPPVVGRRRRKRASIDGLPDFSGAKDSAAGEIVDVTKSETLFHIDCPNGHQLDVEREMLEKTALCPHCNVKFKLLERDSVEFKRKEEIREEQHERKVSSTWLNWAVAISVMVVIFLVALALLWNK